MDEIGVESCGKFLQNGLEKQCDVQLLLADADVCSLIDVVSCGSHDALSFVEIEEDASGKSDLALITTCWLCNLPETQIQRVDVATVDDQVQHLDKVADLVEAMDSFPVTHLPGHLDHDADVRLLVHDAGLDCVSILAICDIGQTRLWKHARVKSKLDIHVVDNLMEGHEWTWVEFNGIRLTRHDLVRGTVTLVNGDAICCGYNHEVQADKWLRSTLEDGEAPCPRDHWCADLDSLDFEADPSCCWIDEIPHQWATPQSGQQPCRKIEGWQAEHGSTVEKDSHQKVQISLESTICHGDHREGSCVQLWKNPDWIEKLWEPWSTALCPLPDGIRVHKNTAKALANDCPLHQMIPETFFIYVDGSASKHGSGWALALVAEGQRQDGSKGVHLCGSLWGKITIDPKSEAWIGASVGDSTDAEVIAAIIALLFTVANPMMFDGKPVFLCPDLQYSQGLVEGKFTPHLHRQITAVLSKLGSVTSHTQMAVLHARAHRGWEWNELVDVLAKHAVDDGRVWIPDEAKVVAEMIHVGIESVGMDWHPLMMERSMKDTIPPTIDHCLFDVAIPPERGELIIESVQGDAVGKEDQVHMHVMTFNILSLRPGGEQDHLIGRQFDAKTERVDIQAFQLDIDVLCIQEARTDAGQYTSQHYDIFASGAGRCGNSLHYGCEIWIRKGKGFSISQAQVVLAEERILMIRILQGDTPWLVISAHAPSIGPKCDTDMVHKWWSRFAGLVRKHQNGDWLIVGLDANACLASESSEHFSMLDASDGGTAGEFFEKFVQDSNLFVPSTFSHIHEGDSWTWKHPKGKRKRIDFILTSMSLCSWCLKTFVCLDFDSGFAHEDHLPVVLELKGTCFVPEARPRLDEGKMIEPVLCAAFQQALRTLPVPHWSVDVDQHADIMRSQCRQLATQFFSKTSAPRKAKWMSEGTASLIQFKRQVLQLLRQSHNDEEQLEVKQELRCLEKMVAVSCANDKRKFFADIATQLQVNGEAGDFKQVFACLGKLSSKRKRKAGNLPRPLPQIDVGPEQAVGSFMERQDVFFRQFAEIESARVMEADEVVRETCQDRPKVLQHIDARFIPSLAQIGRKLQRLKRGKAPGPDQIVPSLLKAGGPIIARHLASLFAKVALWSSEPLQWKTGILVALFKKGSHRDPSNYRSIYISDHIAKIYHSCVRDHLGELYEENALDTQMGGRKGKGTDMAHHILQTFQAATKQANISSAVFFLDLHSAFYAVLRQFLFDTGWNDDMLCKLLQRLGIHPDEVESFKKRCRDENATRDMHPHGVSILKDIFDGANFQMRGVDKVGVPQRGTRPGDPVGDVCFNLLMCSMLKEYRSEMQASNMQWLPNSIPEGSDEWKNGFVFPTGATFYDVSFVDDVSVMVAHTHGHELVPTAKTIAQCWCQTAARRGLLVNFKPEKTELMITFRGKGCRLLKQQYFVSSPPEIALSDLAVPHKLQLVHSYKHVGTQIQSDGRPRKDIQYRVAKAKQAWGPLQKPFFGKREVSVETKVQIFQSLVLSRFAFQVHTWTMASNDMLERWHNAIKPMVFSMARQKVGAFALETLDVTTICGLICLPSPHDLLAKNRSIGVVEFDSWSYQPRRMGISVGAWSQVVM